MAYIGSDCEFADGSLEQTPSVSGSEVCLPGRISADNLSGKLQNRPAGWPKAGRRGDFDVFPNRVRPKSGPETRFQARKHYCATSGKSLKTVSSQTDHWSLTLGLCLVSKRTPNSLIVRRFGVTTLARVPPLPLKGPRH